MVSNSSRNNDPAKQRINPIDSLNNYRTVE